MAQARKATSQDLQDMFADDEVTTNGADVSEDSYSAFLAGIARSVFQGVTFGTADEIEAAIRSTFGDQGYYAVRDEIRSNLDKFRDENTALAYGLEIGSSLLLPMGAVGAGMRLAPQATRAGVSLARQYPVTAAGLAGATYGAGVAEEVEDIPLEASIAGTIGLGAGAVSPVISRKAQALRQAGLPLTVGQLYPALKRGEEALTSLPIMGGQVARAIEKPIEAFPALVYNRALRPLGIKIDPKASPRQAFIQSKKAFDDAYDKALSGVDVDVTPDFLKQLEDISRAAKENLGIAGGSLGKDFDNIIKARVLGKVKDGKISGRDLKEIQSFLGSRSVRYRKSPDPLNQDYADALEELDIGLMDAFTKSAPAEKSSLLRKANRAYSRYVPLRRAASMADEGEFSPAQMLRSIQAEERKRGAEGLGRLAAGRGTMQPTAEVAKDILGAKLGDSGTSSREQMGRLARSVIGAGGLGAGGTGILAGMIEPMTAAKTIGGGLIGAGLYTPSGQKILRGAIPAVSTGIRTPAIAGLLADYTVSP